MKFGLITTNLRCGDAEKAMLKLSAQLAGRGHETHLLVLEHRVEHNLPSGVRVTALTELSQPPCKGLLGKHLVAYAPRVARRGVAFRQTDEKLNSRLHCCVEGPAFQGEHAVLELLHLPAAIVIPRAELRLECAMTPSEETWAMQRPERGLPPSCTPLIGMQVASFPTKAYRNWPIENFKALSKRIAQRWPEAHFLIFGAHKRTRNYGGAQGTPWKMRHALRRTPESARDGCTDEPDGSLYWRRHRPDTPDAHARYSTRRPLPWFFTKPTHLSPPAPNGSLPRANQHYPTEAPMSDITVKRVWQTVEQALTHRLTNHETHASGQ